MAEKKGSRHFSTANKYGRICWDLIPINSAEVSTSGMDKWTEIVQISNNCKKMPRGHWQV